MKQETKIENDFVDKVREAPFPAIALKLILFAGRGFPDRTVLGKGKIFFIEFKRPENKKLDPPQIRWKKILTKLGFNVYVCTSTEEAYQIFIEEMESS